MKKKQIIAGVDEVGRGCLAGPVVSAAVILKQGINLHKRNAEKVDMKSKKKDSTTTVPLVIEEDKIKTGLRMCRR